jgi:hypothetical protein
LDYPDFRPSGYPEETVPYPVQSVQPTYLKPYLPIETICQKSNNFHVSYTVTITSYTVPVPASFTGISKAF